MILRLVSDNSEPIADRATVAAHARAFADAVERGEYGDVTRVALAVEYDGGLDAIGWGEACRPYDLMGLFEAAKLFVFADNIPE